METWKDIEGYEGMYQVSDAGRVRSLDRYVNHVTGKRITRGKIMRPHAMPNGYFTIGLSIGRRRRDYYIHRLVASAFIENKDGLPQVNHKDEDKSNNAACNLEWCDQSYNNNYGTKNKRFRASRGTAIEMISNGAIVREFVSMRQAEAETGLRRKSISECCRGIIQSYHGYEFRYKG